MAHVFVYDIYVFAQQINVTLTRNECVSIKF